MPRRPTIARKTKYQGVPSTRLSSRFATKLMTDGKRHLSERILREALARAEAQARRPGIEVLESAMRNATPIIEVKPRRVGGATYQVPVDVKPRRAATLSVRWLVGYSKQRREKTMSERLANELIDASNGVGAAVKRREDMHKMADSNRAFAHYRW